MMVALKRLPGLFLYVGNKGFCVPNDQLKLVYVERIEKVTATSRYRVRRYAKEQNSLRIERHVLEG
jgi:hypothetical protein